MQREHVSMDYVFSVMTIVYLYLHFCWYIITDIYKVTKHVYVKYMLFF